ncbi:MAG: hypothetical protein ABL989_04985 [Gammaproteobacteria bacterium]
MDEIGVRSLLRPPAGLCDLARRSILLALAALPAVASAAGPGAIAVQAVADAIGVTPAAARVVSSEARDFPDASLGCPQPGMAYAQVITPGHRVIVEADGRRFDVRVAGNGGRLCYLRKPATGPGGTGRPRESGETARQDLARRLALPPEAVTISGLRRLNPGETLPGCGEVCAPATAATACGVGVRLRAGERDFDYVALDTGVHPCPDIAPR